MGAAHALRGKGQHVIPAEPDDAGDLGKRYYGFPEHRSDPSVGQVTGCHSQLSTYLNSAGNPGETEMKAKRCIRVGYIPLYDMNIYN